MAQAQPQTQKQPQKTNPAMPATKAAPQKSAPQNTAQQNKPSMAPLVEEKKFYQKWWFLVLLGIVILGGISLFLYLIF